MRALAILVLLFGLAAPLAAEWRGNGTTNTWYVQRVTAEMQELRDALFWHYEGQGIDGALSLGARPNIALTSIGGGNSELAITMPKTASDAWGVAYAARACPSANTAQLRAACTDAAIKQDLGRIWHRYKLHLRDLADPPPPVPVL